MIQFTKEEVESFRNSKDYSRILELLYSRVKQFLEHEILVPQTSISNWSHYFYCPDCSVALIHDLDKPHDHECPICHKHFSDELKDGAWWRITNTFNEEAAIDIGRIYMLTGDKTITRKAIDVMLEYARYYPSYQTHGDIPYNGPGKLNAQTLDESNFLRNMAYAYDLLSEAMTSEEKCFIKDNLFKVGAAFLVENRHSQLHNHEVICNGAIGVLALVLEDMSLLDFAMNSRYGLVYQLEHGTLEDGFWFECSTAYHFYALQNFLLYEKFARHTDYSNLANPKYPAMLSSILRLQKSDLSFPLLNDSHLHQGEPNAYDLFEFSYATWKDDRVLQILHKLYESSDRLSIESFFYGEKELPACRNLPVVGNLVGDNGLGASIIRRGKDYLLFRHGPYGGEHDHYDRLSFSYYNDDIPVSIDIGTTGYGAPLHYAYYKRTCTHNTISINGANQAPSSGRLLRFEEKSDMVLVSAECEWIDNYSMPDSFTIKQWDDEAYRNVVMRRTLAVTDFGIIDYFRIDGVGKGSIIDLNYHFHGNVVKLPVLGEMTVLGDEEPYSFFHDSRLIDEEEKTHVVFKNDGVVTDFFCKMDSSVILSRAFDNPSNKDMNYITLRSYGSSTVFRSFFSSGRAERVVDVEFEESSVSIRTADGIVHRFVLEV